MSISETRTKCQYCGGLLKNFSYGVKKCTCCNSIFEIEYKNPSLLDEANELRKQNCFEESLKLYEKVLSDDNNYPEANWGALLSKYGIEYVREGNNFIPTIHRPVQNYKITDDRYAINILENTFGDDKDYYLNKINELEKIRSEIETKSQNLPQYDVFISCKITQISTLDGEKTKEYEWGEQIYKKLIQKGFKVFFSPFSLPASNGSYEPIIYSALQSAKYMVILASSIDNLNSKWIKNEWGRFLEIKKHYSQEPKYYKLVIENCVAKDVPVELRDVSFIEHDDKNIWLNNLEEAVLYAFPDYKKRQYREFNPSVDTVNLDCIKKNKSKILKPIKNAIEYSSIPVVLKNPYTVQLFQLEEDYTIDDNVQACIRFVEIQLRNGNYSEAQYELNKYLDFFDDYEHLDYNILILKLLIESKAKNLDDFFKNRIVEFNDFKLFKDIISKIDKDGITKFVDPICEFILESIRSCTSNNSIEFYKIISTINFEKINKLNYSVFESLPYLYRNSKLLEEFSQITLSCIATYNIEDYIKLAYEFSKSLCNNGLFDVAKNVTKDLMIADPYDSSIALMDLMAKNNSRTIDDLLPCIETNEKINNEFNSILPKLYRTGHTYFINIIKRRINELINKKEYQKASTWLNIMCNISFEDRTDFFKDVLSKCKSDFNSEEAYYIAMETLGEDDKDFFIKTTIDFINLLIRNRKFDLAKKYCKIVEEYDAENKEVLELHLFAELESDNYNYDNINLLKDMSIVEKLLVTQESVYARQENLNYLLNACIKYIDNKDIDIHDSIFNVFDKLITYCHNIENDRVVKNKINQFAEKCLIKRLFEKAKWYYILLIRIDKTYHNAYWGIIKSELKCVNEEEMVCSSRKINSFPEYSLAIMYANGDEKAEDNYANTLFKQLHFNKKKKCSKFILIGVFAVVGIILGVALLFKFLN